MRSGWLTKLSGRAPATPWTAKDAIRDRRVAKNLPQGTHQGIFHCVTFVFVLYICITEKGSILGALGMTLSAHSSQSFWFCFLRLITNNLHLSEVLHTKMGWDSSIFEDFVLVPV